MCIFNSIKFNYLFIKGVHYFWSNHLQTPWLCSLYIIVYSSNFPPVVLGYLGTDGIFLKSLFSIYCCYTKDLVIVENIPFDSAPDLIDLEAAPWCLVFFYVQKTMILFLLLMLHKCYQTNFLKRINIIVLKNKPYFVW